MSSQEEGELGTLIVVILKARNLNDKHSFYKQDVFAQATLNGTTKKTHVNVKGGQHPEWDEEIRFSIMKDASDKHRKLDVACFAKEPRSDDLLGKGQVDISETLRTGEFDDWVNLEVNGVSRGELYLEMTYYANVAPPMKLAPNPINTNLTRHPSKLPPSDRLHRPSHTSVPPAVSPDKYLIPPSVSPPRSPSPARASLPVALAPGGGMRPNQSHGSPKPVPSILRPGKPRTSPVSVPQSLPNNAQPSYSPPAVYTPVSHTPAPPPIQQNDYSPATTPPQHHNIQSQAPLSYSSSTPAQAPSYPNAAAQALWSANTAPPLNISFPVPSVTPVSEAYRPPLEAQKHDSGLPDPYLLARYQTPLPLPPGATRPPSNHQIPTNTMGPTHVGYSTPPRVATQTPIGSARLEALRIAEEEAARRKAQEDKDLELALQLDRELNLAEANSNSQRPPQHGLPASNMPGGW
ncbi:hypothetical protein BD779DRAFT_1496727 [Infundibulicybe gibba]|nr:hypothetical protein BD779DRAFT_1496727 [Infundibulicybe gibba]